MKTHFEKPKAVSESIFEEKVLPKIIKDNNLLLLDFELMKRIPVKYVIDKAIEDGTLKKDGTIIESSSGSYALALAEYGMIYGYSIIIVASSAINKMLKNRLEALGAKLIYPNGNNQEVRVKFIEEYLKNNEDIFHTNQYANRDNCIAYYDVIDKISSQSSNIDILVTTVGTGVSISGMAERLLQKNPATKIVGVDVFGSMSFHKVDSNDYNMNLVSGFGSNRIMENLNYSIIDEVHWLTANEIHLSAKKLYETYGIYKGPSSGVAWWVAKYYAQKYPCKKVAVVLPDNGDRYFETTYSEQFFKEHNFNNEIPNNPQIIEQLDNLANNQWSCFSWLRKDRKIT